VTATALDPKVLRPIAALPEHLRLALAGGGTGGHLVPGLHLLDHLLRQADGLDDLLWISSGRAIEERVLAGIDQRLGEVNLERVCLDLEPPGGGAPGLGRISARLPAAVSHARRSLQQHRSEIVLGLGGFASAPAVLAARSLGLPVAMLEINAVAGRATRALAPLCARVFHAWEDSLPARRGRRHRFCGPPLARAFLDGPADETRRRAAKSAQGFDGDRPLLVVLGGSQGALGLNDFVQAHVQAWLSRGIQVLHQVGPGRLREGAEAREGYRAREYVREVSEVLSAADFVLCRGGASTVAEIAGKGVPAWVVPYPHHADHHQERNARAAGLCVKSEPELGAEVAEELALVLVPEGAGERALLRARRTAGLAPHERDDGASRILSELGDLARALRWKRSRR
jgi:UDP-N-acetylglucosamine--N-acetylmuramyl-(pentapeptide) pyrophosphoryl-undecaprenol N-acetylglucosamine transferase